MSAAGTAKTSIAWMLLAASVACGDSDPVDPGPLSEAEDVTFAPALGVDLSQMTRLESGVYIQDLDVPDPDAEEVRPLFFLWVTYDGWLSDGTQFAADEELPSLRIASGEVISGWFAVSGIPLSSRSN